MQNACVSVNLLMKKKKKKDDEEKESRMKKKKKKSNRFMVFLDNKKQVQKYRIKYIVYLE